jgi:hypothetical protein
VLLCSVFAATHGLLGALVVPAVAAGPVVEICTPNGLQWVSLGDAQGGEPPANSPHGMAQPCVWAMAHLAVPPGMEGRVALPGWANPPEASPMGGGEWVGRLAATAARVLLMAPMRAPPA